MSDNRDSTSLSLSLLGVVIVLTVIAFSINAVSTQVARLAEAVRIASARCL